MAKVLIAEDNIGVAKMVAFVLRNEGIDSKIAVNVPHAIDAITYEIFDAISLDMVFGQGAEKTGLDFLEAVPQETRNKTVILSGYTGLAREGLVAKYGVYDVFDKGGKDTGYMQAIKDLCNAA